MKKNIAMRVAAFLFILTMISTCAFATTFAKYTTKGEATDEARVAKWGVTVAAETPDNKEYHLEAGEAGQDAEIIADANVKTIAPGSYVKFATINLSGTPEVSVSVTYEATLTLTNWKDGNGAEYCPLVFIVSYGNARTELSKEAGETVAEFAGRVVAAINSTRTLTPNKDVSQLADLTVQCQWAYAGNDSADTALGNAAADADTNNDPSISLTIKCTVTQLD